MLILLSGSRAFREDEIPGRLSPPALSWTRAALDAQHALVLEQLRALSAEELHNVLGINMRAAELNHSRYAGWEEQPKAPALLAFSGEGRPANQAYRSLAAHDLSVADVEWAQEHVRILSPLYGILRPLDAIRPHCLDATSTLTMPGGVSLPAFWGAAVAEHINSCLEGQPASEGRFVLHCAADEDWALVDAAALRFPVVRCRFPESASYERQGEGSLTRHLIEQRATSLDQVRSFSGDRGRGHDWRLDEAALDDQVLVWIVSRLHVPLTGSRAEAQRQLEEAHAVEMVREKEEREREREEGAGEAGMELAEVAQVGAEPPAEAPVEEEGEGGGDGAAGAEAVAPAQVVGAGGVEVPVDAVAADQAHGEPAIAPPEAEGAADVEEEGEGERAQEDVAGAGEAETGLGEEGDGGAKPPADVGAGGSEEGKDAEEEGAGAEGEHVEEEVKKPGKGKGRKGAKKKGAAKKGASKAGSHTAKGRRAPSAAAEGGKGAAVQEEEPARETRAGKGKRKRAEHQEEPQHEDPVAKRTRSKRA